MYDGLRMLAEGLVNVFIVLATIFIGIRLIHWLTPQQPQAPLPIAVQETSQQSEVRTNQNQSASLTAEELAAAQMIIAQATGGKGKLSKII